MSDLQIVRTQSIGFGEHGQDVCSDDVFIKVLVSFQERLMQLKNARLAVFMAVATQEAKIILKNANPLSLRKMQTIVPYSRPSIVDALDYLVEYRFLIELPDRGADGEKQYRVCQYAWFGTKGGEPAFHPGSAADIPAQPPACLPGDPETGGKNSLPPPSPGGTSVPISPKSGSKDFSREEKISLTRGPLEVVVVPPSNEVKEKTTSTTEVRAQVRKIFSTVGMYGEDLERVSAVVMAEHAKSIARWINWAKDEAPKYESPAGIALWHLLKDPAWAPSEPAKHWDREEYDWNYVPVSWDHDFVADERAEPESVESATVPILAQGYNARLSEGGPDAYSIWQETLKELQLSMTRATFDTWVRPTAALGFDTDGALTIRVHSRYAKEWLENRIYNTITRTLMGIMEKPIKIRFQAPGDNGAG